MAMWTNNVERMSILSGGNVGIGTTSPIARLDIRGGSDGDIMISMGTNSVSGILNAPANMYINADSSNSSASGLIAFGFNRTGFSGGAETMRLLENGTVGIGTITPATKLDVRGYITSDVNSNAVEGGFYLGNSGHGLRRPGGASNDVYLYTTSGNVFIGAAGSTSQQITVLTGGNVGIGTTNPLTQLHVNNTVGTGLTLSNTVASLYAEMRFQSANSSAYIFKNSTGYTSYGGADALNIFNEGQIALHSSTVSNIMYLTAVGNVGIGNTVPGQKFAVQGEIAKYTTTGIDGTFDNFIKYGYFADLQAGSATTNRNHSIEGKLTAGGPSDNALRFRVYQGNAAQDQPPLVVMSLLGNGNVGIGTTTPASLLQVVGASGLNNGVLNISNTHAAGGVYFPASKIRNTRGDHSFGIVSEFSIGNVGGVDRSSILFYTDDSAHSWQVGQVTSPWGTVDSFGIGYRASNTPSSFSNWPTNYFNVTPTGNVGIGTGTPSQKLQVAGAIAATLSNVNQVNAVMYNSGTGLFTYVGTGSIVIGTATNADNVYINEDATAADQPVLFAQNTEAYYPVRGNKTQFTYNPGTNTLTAGTYIETSALKFKENIVHLTGSLHQVEKLQGVSYNRIGQDHREIGLIADEVVKILPELVKYQDGQVYGLSYNRITAVLVEAVKELSDKVKQQEIFIQDLADRLKKQEDKG
jgi:hypothetical protein